MGHPSLCSGVRLPRENRSNSEIWGAAVPSWISGLAGWCAMSEDHVLLAFDTSSSLGSVALARGSEVLALGWLTDARQHASQLVPEIAASLGRSGLDREEIRGVVVGQGPGSFTGLRVAAATAKGLSRSFGVPLWHHSSLAAAAASEGAHVPESVMNRRGGLHALSVDTAEAPRYVLFDARSDRVYAACYQILNEGILCLIEPTATTVSRVLSEPIPAGSQFVGEGALRHASAIEESGHAVLPFPAGIPTAEGLLCAHRLFAEIEPAQTGSWEPEYLRDFAAAAPEPLGRRE